MRSDCRCQATSEAGTTMKPSFPTEGVFGVRATCCRLGIGQSDRVHLKTNRQNQRAESQQLSLRIENRIPKR